MLSLKNWIVVFKEKLKEYFSVSSLLFIHLRRNLNKVIYFHFVELENSGLSESTNPRFNFLGFLFQFCCLRPSTEVGGLNYK